MSTKMQGLVNKRPKKQSANRASPQVISGAGLYMSRKAIQSLPPFMNFDNMITWVDDHLKRRLHEAIGDLSELSLERVSGALFQQDRYPKGINAGDIDWVSDTYLTRVLQGCLLHAMIMAPNGNPGLLSKVVGETIISQSPPTELDELRKNLTEEAESTANAILEIWKDADYGTSLGRVNNSQGVAGTNLLNRWATNLSLPATVRSICIATVEDAIHYTQLVARWPRYVDAIERLRPVDAYWLFMRGT